MANGNAMVNVSNKEVITILSIDGGGVRGIIPAAVLDFLEKRLQIDENPNARIADYFDYIAGTSTGGLLTAMITAPNEQDRPLYAATYIVQFYINQCPNIFPKEKRDDVESMINEWDKDLAAVTTASTDGTSKSESSVERSARSLTDKIKTAVDSAWKLISALGWPRYDGSQLREIMKQQLEEKMLSQTKTNVIIPAFDIKFLEGTIFSTSKAIQDKTMDVPLAEVCLATSAAPIYLPPRYIQTKTEYKQSFMGESTPDFPKEERYTDRDAGILKEYNLVDGGIAANNPTFVAICEAIKEKKIDSSKLLVLSLGTGSISKRHNKLKVGAEPWGLFRWFFRPGNACPLIDVLFSAADHMIEMYTSSFFQVPPGSIDNYVRIQANNLEPEEATLDNSAPDNLERLKQIGTNLATANEGKLKKFAKRLSDIKKARPADPSG